jgi:hypothetical protein
MFELVVNGGNHCLSQPFIVDDVQYSSAFIHCDYPVTPGVYFYNSEDCSDTAALITPANPTGVCVNAPNVGSLLTFYCLSLDK